MSARRVEPSWQPCYRAIPSRFPPISLFERVARPEEFEAVYAIQALTNPRLREQAGEISLVPAAERVVGPGSTPVMAAFTHLNRQGSRFSDGTWGVYYAGDSLETAVSEVSFHCARFMAETRQPAIDVDYRTYAARLLRPMHDIRGHRWAAEHQADSYGPSVKLARELRAAGSWGLLYRSVRRTGGECVAVFRPPALQVPVVQSAHLSLRWDGKAISGWYHKSDHHALLAPGSPER